MSDKETEKLDDETQVLDDKTEILSEDDSNLVEKDGIKYETNDDWTFDAVAPTLSNDAFETEKFSVEFEKPKSSTSRKQDEPEKNQAPQNNSSDVLQFILVGIITAIIVGLLTFLGINYYTHPNGKEGKLLNPAGIVAEIDGTPISVGTFNIYYSSVVESYESSYGLDPSIDYDLQYTTNEEGNQITYTELFKSETLEGIKQIVLSYNLAVESGLELTDAQQKFIDDKINDCKTQADSQQIKLNDYLADTYGQYCTEETVRTYFEQLILALSYQGYFQTTQSITDQDIEDYFAKNKLEFSHMNCCYLIIPYDSTSSLEEVEQTVNQLMDKVTDRDSLVELIPDACSLLIEKYIPMYVEEYQITEQEAREQIIEELEESIDIAMDGQNTNFGDDIRQWLFSEETQIGDKNYYINSEDYDGMSFAYIFLKTEEPYIDDAEVYSVRHILIMPGYDEEEGTTVQSDAEPTDEQWTEAEQKANEILDEFNQTDKTESTFAVMAEKYSQDPGSTVLGGYGLYGGCYEQITKGEMVPEFENWAFDDSRKYGDVEIVKTDLGYHIMFFVYKTTDSLAKSRAYIVADAYQAILDSYEIKVNDKKIDKAIENYYLDVANSAQSDSFDYSDYSDYASADYYGQ